MEFEDYSVKLAVGSTEGLSEKELKVIKIAQDLNQLPATEIPVSIELKNGLYHVRFANSSVTLSKL